MDESLQQLENELKSLRLSDPSPQLVDRLTAELAAETADLAAPVHRYSAATNLRSWKWLGWRTASLAAALAVVAAVILETFKRPSSAMPAPPARLAIAGPAPAISAPSADRGQFLPVAATNVLFDMKDEGLVNVDHDTPARRVRYRYVDTYTWKNPRNNSSLKWSVPRDEIRVLPASLH